MAHFGDLSVEDLTTPAQKDPNGKLSRNIAAATPFTWPDGPDKGRIPRMYHAITRGLILNQILRRADPAGRIAGEILAQELAGPLGCDLYLGESTRYWERFGKRIALLRGPPKPWRFANNTVTRVARAMLKERFPPSSFSKKLEAYLATGWGK